MISKELWARTWPEIHQFFECEDSRLEDAALELFDSGWHPTEIIRLFVKVWNAALDEST